jgi:NADPH:quinone reductase-like Zn-dependent oxidoreductase
VLGTDLAGVVEAVGAGVHDFVIGDEVFGLTGGVRGLQGSLAEYAAVDARLLAKKPRNPSMREAAALPLVCLTAWEGLVDRANVRSGQKVLVHAAAGGVGHVAVQIAKALGAEVFATASTPQKLDVARQFGATPINYREQKVAEYVEQHTGGKGFDIVYDTVGGVTLDDSFKAMRHYGHVLSCAAFGYHGLATGSLRAMTLSGVYVLLPMLSGEGRAHHGEILRQVAKLAEDGQLRPLLDPRRFTLETAMQAHAVQGAGDSIGKLVIDIA